VERSTDNRKVEGSTPFRPIPILSQYLGPFGILCDNITCLLYRKKIPCRPDTIRQYPRRFQYFIGGSSRNIEKTGQGICLKTRPRGNSKKQAKRKFDVDPGKPHVIYRLSKGKGQKMRNSRILHHIASTRIYHLYLMV
jgi:hypothetical protein